MVWSWANLGDPVGSFVYRMPPTGHARTSRWIERTRASRPTFSGLLIQDVRTYPLQPWPEMGVNGLYIQMADYQIVDGWILEIPPGGSTTPQRHLFEAGVYFLGGPGHTILQQEGRPPQRIDWKHRSLFSIPLNVQLSALQRQRPPGAARRRHQLPVCDELDRQRALRLREPVRVSRPLRRRAGLRDADGIGEEEPDPRPISSTTRWSSELDDHEIRGPGATNMHWSMAGNTMVDLHASEIPAGRLQARAPPQQRCLHPDAVGRGLLAHLARGTVRPADPGGLAGRHALCSADLLVPPAPEPRHGPGALPGHQRVDAGTTARAPLLRSDRAGPAPDRAGVRRRGRQERRAGARRR